MADNTESFEPYERTHQLVESLLHGERPEQWPDLSPQEADMVRVAGALNSVGASAQPRPEFVRALAHELQQGSQPAPRQLWSRLTRRGLLRGIGSAAGLLILGAAADRAVSSVGHTGAGRGWVAVARAAELTPGSAVRFLAAGREGYMLNVDGAFRAVSALCTHLPCVLQWSGSEREFVCPCHEAEFTVDGQHRPTPSYDHQLAPLPTFPVKQIGSLIYVFPGESSAMAPEASLDEDEEYRRP